MWENTTYRLLCFAEILAWIFGYKSTKRKTKQTNKLSVWLSRYLSGFYNLAVLIVPISYAIHMLYIKPAAVTAQSLLNSPFFRDRLRDILDFHLPMSSWVIIFLFFSFLSYFGVAKAVSRWAVSHTAMPFRKWKSHLCYSHTLKTFH